MEMGRSGNSVLCEESQPRMAEKERHFYEGYGTAQAQKRGEDRGGLYGADLPGGRGGSRLRLLSLDVE